jgi:hypothetical protein
MLTSGRIDARPPVSAASAAAGYAPEHPPVAEATLVGLATAATATPAAAANSDAMAAYKVNDRDARAKASPAAPMTPASRQPARIPSHVREPAASAPSADDVDFGI